MKPLVSFLCHRFSAAFHSSYYKSFIPVIIRCRLYLSATCFFLSPCIYCCFPYSISLPFVVSFFSFLFLVSPFSICLSSFSFVWTSFLPSANTSYHCSFLHCPPTMTSHLVVATYNLPLSLIYNLLYTILYRYSAVLCESNSISKSDTDS